MKGGTIHIQLYGSLMIYGCFSNVPVAVVQITSKGLSTGSIVGIVVGAVAFIAILAAFATFLILLRYRKKRRRLGE